MRTFLQDLIYGARTARRQPGFSLVVVLTLALAIGANTVIFSFANILLIRPLPIGARRRHARVGLPRRPAHARRPRAAVDSGVPGLPPLADVVRRRSARPSAAT